MSGAYLNKVSLLGDTLGEKKNFSNSMDSLKTISMMKSFTYKCTMCLF